MAEIDPVILQLRADLQDYQAKLAQAERVSDQRLGAIEKRGERMGTALKKGFSLASTAAVAFAGTLGTAKLIQLGSAAVETALRFKRFEQGLAIATGSSANAGKEIQFLREMADSLGLRFITLAESFTGFAAAARGTALEGEKTREVFEGITKAIIATGGSADQVDGALLAVQQMMSKGNVSAEELRGQLGERLPGAFQIAARAMGVTTGELDKMLQKGEILATDFLPKFTEQLGKELPASLETADAAFQRFQTALDDVANSTADGFMKQLGEATDDLTVTLKDLQSSGALEAIGSFLGNVIRLGSSAAQVIGDLALAWRRFTLQKGVNQQQSVIDGWFTSDADKQKAKYTQAMMQAELSRMDNPGKGSFDQKSQDAVAAMISPTGSGGGGAASVSSGGSAKKGRASRGPSGPSAAELESRHQRELSRLRVEEMAAKLRLATDAGERADLSKDMLSEEREQRILEISSDKDLTAERRKAQLAYIDALYGKAATAGEDGIEVQGRPGVLMQLINRELEDEIRAAREENLRYELDALRSQGDLATSREQRLSIERRILDALESQERDELDAAIEAGRIADANKARADLATKQANRRTGVEQDGESPLARRRREVRETTANMGDEVEDIQLDAFDRLTDGLADASTEYIKLGGVAGDVINGIIRDLVRLAAQQAIFGTGGGGGILGTIGAFLGIGGSAAGVGGAKSIANGKGFASGGYTGDGNPNEPAGIVHKGEYVIPANAVKRLGVQNLAALASGSAAASMTGVAATARAAPTVVTQVMKFDLTGAVVTEQLLQQMNQMAQSAGIAGAAAGSNQAQAAIMQRGRRRIPGR